MFSETCSNFFQDARRRSADDELWNWKREINFKGSRLRYLVTRGGMALAVRRCVTGISSNRLGVAFLVGIHRTSVNRWELALQLRAWRAGRLGTEMRKRNKTERKNRVTLIASFDSHCIFTQETPPTQLSAGRRNCKTAKQGPCILSWTSTRRRRGLTCARMSARRAP